MQTADGAHAQYFDCCCRNNATYDPGTWLTEAPGVYDVWSIITF